MKRLTPIVPGQVQPVMFGDGVVRTGLISGGPTKGRGFPQWAIRIDKWGKVHFYRSNDNLGALSLCGRHEPIELLFLPGNFPRCGRCVKALAVRRKYGLSP